MGKEYFEFYCDDVMTKWADYFDGKLSTAEDIAIEEHLVTCDDCYKKYLKRVAETGNDEYIELMKSITEMVYKERIRIFKENNKREDNWTEIASQKDFESLKDLKCYSDLKPELESLMDAKIPNTGKYIFYITTKLCQKVDHLDNCYNLEKEDEGNEEIL